MDTDKGDVKNRDKINIEYGGRTNKDIKVREDLAKTRNEGKKIEKKQSN